MGTKRAYVGNLPWSTSEQDLRNLFAEFGVVKVNIITDRDTGRPRGFAFIELQSEKAVEDAIQELDGIDYGGRTLRVSVANDRPKDQRRGQKRDDDVRRR